MADSGGVGAEEDAGSRCVISGWTIPQMRMMTCVSI